MAIFHVSESAVDDVGISKLAINELGSNTPVLEIFGDTKLGQVLGKDE